MTANSIDHTNEKRFYERRESLQALKKKIGELSRKIDIELLNHNTAKNCKSANELLTATKQVCSWQNYRNDLDP